MHRAIGHRTATTGKPLGRDAYLTERHVQLHADLAVDVRVLLDDHGDGVVRGGALLVRHRQVEAVQAGHHVHQLARGAVQWSAHQTQLANERFRQVSKVKLLFVGRTHPQHILFASRNNRTLTKQCLNII